MKTVVKGKIVENAYSVIPHTKEIKDESGNVIDIIDQLKMNPEL